MPVWRPPTKYTDFTSGGEGAGVAVYATGLQALVETLRSMPRIAQVAAGYRMQQIAEEIIEDARANYVPYRDGYLRDSAGWDTFKPTTNADVTKIGMWFGAPMSGIQMRQTATALLQLGVKTPRPDKYAWDQHETISYIHPNLGVVTNPQAKYLERPFLKREPSFLAEIADAVSKEWGGAATDRPGPSIDANTPASWWQIMDIPITPSEGAR